GCRNLWVDGIYGLWILSAIVTSIMNMRIIKEFFSLNDHRVWSIVLGKDVLAFCGSLILILGSAVGSFNKCWCWSVRLTKCEAGVVPLNTDDDYDARDRKVYDIIVWTCIGCRLFFHSALIWYS